MISTTLHRAVTTALVASLLAPAAGCVHTDDDPATGTRAQAIAFAACVPGGPTAADAAIADQARALLTGPNLGGGSLNSYHVSCARIITDTARGRGLAQRAAVIAVTTAITESTLHNYTEAVDHDSLGLFQQRPAAGWGTPAQLVDPVYATNAFLNAMLKKFPNNSWLTGDIGAICQAVQVSAFPGRYALEVHDAQVLVDALWAPSAPKVDEVARARGDFNGDGLEDIAGFYDYGGATAKLWVWYGTAAGIAPPVMKWESVAGGWNLSLSRLVTGDFDGDGRADLGGFYDYGGATTKLWVWRGTATGFAAPVLMWNGVAGGWNLPQSRFVTGDFDGDGRIDIAGLYDYGGARTGLWVWYGTATGFVAPSQKWDSGAGGWNLAQSRFVAGDFDGDGKADVGGFYDYGASTTKLWLWRGTAAGFTAPAIKWESAAGGWALPQSRPMAGDFDGDGRRDIAAFYDHDAATTKLWVWRGTASGVAAPSLMWASAAGGWNLSQSRFVTGDFDDDGKTDLGGFYDYGGGTTKLWVWRGTATSVTAAVQNWDSGPNNWFMAQTRFQ